MSKKYSLYPKEAVDAVNEAGEWLADELRRTLPAIADKWLESNADQKVFYDLCDKMEWGQWRFIDCLASDRVPGLSGTAHWGLMCMMYRRLLINKWAPIMVALMRGRVSKGEQDEHAK